MKHEINKKDLVAKYYRLSAANKNRVPNPAKITSIRKLWVTDTQAAEICGISQRLVMEKMWEGTAFPSCINIGSNPDYPYYRFLLEDCIDFLLEQQGEGS